LATLLHDLGEYEEAEDLYIRALSIATTVQGKEHPETATLINNLAGLSHEKHHLIEAERLYLDALEITKKTLGDSHPETCTILVNYAYLLKEIGDFLESERLFLLVLQARKRTLGNFHFETTNTMYALAKFYFDQNKLNTAELIIRDEIKIIESLPSTMPISILNSYLCLVDILRGLNRIDEMQIEISKAIKINDKINSKVTYD
jgi:tetratricopeptide (TPR) repeat protein